MPKTLFLGPTYPARSLNIASDRCINFFPEVGPSDAKGEERSGGGAVALVGTPGTTLSFSVAASTIRGMHVFNNLLFFVAGDKLYSMNQLGTVSASLGTLGTSTGRVQMVDNGLAAHGAGGNQLFIVDGTTTGYIYDALTQTFTATSGGISATYLDGYFIAALPNSMVAICSALFDGTSFPPLAQTPISASPENLQGVANLNRQLWFIKEYSSEVWSANNTTTLTGFPFSFIAGMNIDYGTSAPASIARGDQALFFLANARQGDSAKLAGVMMIQGNTPRIISPAAINYQFSQYQVVSDAFGYCRVHEGHSFYVLTFPSVNSGLGATWVYDRTTDMWHEWSTYVEPFQIARHMSNCYAFYGGKEYIGDYSTGNVYELSSTLYTDGALPIISQRICQHQIDRAGMRNVFISRLHVDMETGVGDIGLTTQTGIVPKAMLAWSNDGGHTYSNDYLASIGAVGQYKVRLVWRRLGYARDRVFRLTIGDPVKKILLGGYIN